MKKQMTAVSMALAISALAYAGATEPTEPAQPAISYSDVRPEGFAERPAHEGAGGFYEARPALPDTLSFKPVAPAPDPAPAPEVITNEAEAEVEGD